MHFDHGNIPADYRQYIGRKLAFILVIGCCLTAMFAMAISLGATNVSIVSVARSILGMETSRQVEMIVWNIRMPQAFAAMLAGGGLAIAGAVMQAILRNPLGSPFTLGISHAAAFGAAFSVMVLGSGVMTSSNVGAVSITNPYITTASAFLFSIGTALLIIGVTKTRGATPEIMVLTGVALGAFFTAGTMLLQFFADDMQLAAMVFWTFGDTARATYTELLYICLMTVFCTLYFFANSWNYNAIEAGDETAKGLGIRVDRVRLTSMLLASMLTAVVIAFLGIIGFVGLVVPHMVRRIIGSDHRFLLPACIMVGGLLLLASDTVARLILAPHVLPVSVLTAFLGAPAFFWLIIRGKRR